MPVLRELKGRMRAFRNMHSVTVLNVPQLRELSVSVAFVDVKEVKMENASLLEEIEELSEVKRKQEEEERRRREEERKRRNARKRKSASARKKRSASVRKRKSASAKRKRNAAVRLKLWITKQKLKKLWRVLSVCNLVG